MERFKMPGLSNYDFNLHGECWRKSGRQVQLTNKCGFLLYADNGERIHINPKEAIQYGKHLLHQYNGGTVIMTMKLQSKINTQCHTS